MCVPSGKLFKNKIVRECERPFLSCHVSLTIADKPGQQQQQQQQQTRNNINNRNLRSRSISFWNFLHLICAVGVRRISSPFSLGSIFTAGAFVVASIQSQNVKYFRSLVRSLFGTALFAGHSVTRQRFNHNKAMRGNYSPLPPLPLLPTPALIEALHQLLLLLL